MQNTLKIHVSICENATREIQNAIDRCFCAGGGSVVIEPGVYHIGGIRLRSNVTLYLKSGVSLMATRDAEAYHILDKDDLEPLPETEKTEVLWSPAKPDRCNDYMLKCGGRWSDAIIRLVYAENARVIAEEGAVIDGNNSYDPMGEEHYRGVHGISAYHCKNLEFIGYTIKNTGNWAHCAYFCQGLTFRELTVLAGHDGIHTASCDDVTVENCKLYTGDDCVAGFDLYGLRVKNCLLNTACNVFRLGGTDILIENCSQFGPAEYCFRGSLTADEKKSGAPSRTGRKTTLSAFTYYADLTLKIRHKPGNIVIRNCSFETTKRFLHYNFSGNEPWKAGVPLENITFENVTARNVGMSLCAYGAPGAPVTLTIKNCAISFEEEQKEVIRAANFDLIHLENVNVGNVNGTAVRSWDGKGTLIAENFTGAEPCIADAEEPFFCKAI